MAAAMELHSGERRSEGVGVKVKFIEMQFVSSDAANFKSVVQRLTGKHWQMPPPPPLMHRPRPRSGSSVGAREEERRLASVIVSRSGDEMPRIKLLQQPVSSRRGWRWRSSCDFADLFYATPGARREGGGTINGFPY